ncbi:hypothetical protein B0H34DRAFT_670910 [Crassisporium funariophilum]|nr:hypothetical protein B0H34DRAFT_670910 [Crassisporium funariophilum]
MLFHPSMVDFTQKTWGYQAGKIEWKALLMEGQALTFDLAQAQEKPNNLPTDTASHDNITGTSTDSGGNALDHAVFTSDIKKELEDLDNFCNDDKTHYNMVREADKFLWDQS